MGTESAAEQAVIRRTLEGLVALVAISPPILLFWGLLGSSVLTALLFVVEAALLSAVMGTPREGLVAGGAFILLTPVSLVVGTSPLSAACLMAVVCCITGVSSVWRRFATLYIIPLGMAFLMSLPLDQLSQLLGRDPHSLELLKVLGAQACCGIWTIAVVALLRISKGISMDLRNPTAATIRYTAVMATLVAASTWYALAYGRSIHGVWLVLTLLIVLQIGQGPTLHKVVHRAIGTLPGALVAVLSTPPVAPQWVTYVVLALAVIGFCATAGQEPYWLFVFFLTIMVLLATAMTDADSASLDRVLFTFLGIAVAALVIGLQRLLPAERRGPQPVQAS